MNQSPIFQVSEFNEAINNHLSLLGPIVVEGEVNQINISKGKWVFITICDKKACVNVFSIAYKIPHLSVLKEGSLVHVTGKPALYQKSGKFSLQAESILPAGEGALAIAKEQLKRKLKKEGLFDISHKRKLPEFIESIGLITAKKSRAYSDFLKVLTEKIGGIKIYFYPINVQGNDSIKSIFNAFKYFNNSNLDLDCLVLTRGGGSAKDLISFDNEEVVRAVFSSKHPVLSAIGHEEDVALTDLVADVRASTPSNAADMITQSKTEIIKRINYSLSKIYHNLSTQLYDKQININKSLSVINLYFTKLEVLVSNNKKKLITHFDYYTLRVEEISTIVSDYYKRLSRMIDRLFRQKTTDFNYLLKIINSFDHKQVLQRGFSITRNEKGQVIKSVKELDMEKELKTEFYYGEAISIIKDIRKD